MTERELMSLPEGTKVKINSPYGDVHPAYLKGGILRHWQDPSDDLKPFGIYIEQFDEPGDSGVCYSFEASQYEVINDEMTDVNYWKTRCELTEECLAQNPCDPDMNIDQIKAHKALNDFLYQWGKREK